MTSCNIVITSCNIHRCTYIAHDTSASGRITIRDRQKLTIPRDVPLLSLCANLCASWRVAKGSRRNASASAEGRKPSCAISCIFNARGIANFPLCTWLGCVSFRIASRQCTWSQLTGTTAIIFRRELSPFSLPPSPSHDPPWRSIPDASVAYAAIFFACRSLVRRFLRIGVYMATFAIIRQFYASTVRIAHCDLCTWNFATLMHDRADCSTSWQYLQIQEIF